MTILGRVGGWVVREKQNLYFKTQVEVEVKVELGKTFMSKPIVKLAKGDKTHLRLQILPPLWYTGNIRPVGNRVKTFHITHAVAVAILQVQEAAQDGTIPTPLFVCLSVPLYYLSTCVLLTNAGQDCIWQQSHKNA